MSDLRPGGSGTAQRPVNPNSDVLRFDLAALVVALCGALSQVSVKVIGEMPIGEPLFLLLGAIFFALRGVGPNFSPALFWTLFVSGLLMVVGYIVSDLAAVTGPSQYLRGWARVAMMAVDCIFVQIVVSHGRRFLWWFVVGMVVSILVNNLLAGLPLDTVSWKSGGYGVALGMLAALAVGFLPRVLATVALCGFGLLSAMLDFRSLGGIFLVAGLLLAVRSMTLARARFPVLRITAAIILIGVAITALILVLAGSDSEYLERRLESNAGRYIGLVVAARAIGDSPLVGYGSWAADKRYGQLQRSETALASRHTKNPVDLGESLLPHSQVLQAWVEGGLLGALFFIAYGYCVLRALLWLAHRHEPGLMTPLLIVLLGFGAWNLLASPFLGMHRIFIMVVIGAMALLASERRQATAAVRRAGLPPIAAGLARRR